MVSMLCLRCGLKISFMSTKHHSMSGRYYSKHRNIDEQIAIIGIIGLSVIGLLDTIIIIIIIIMSLCTHLAKFGLLSINGLLLGFP